MVLTTPLWGDVVVCIGEDDEEVEVTVDPEERNHGKRRTVQDELDAALPMKKRSVPFLKKKGKKKKKSSASVTFDYAEAIESEKRMFSDDDFALETEFEEFF